MKAVLFLFFISIVFFSISKAQDNAPSVYETVGFACGFSGVPTEIVEQFTWELNASNYTWLTEQLTSSNNAARYLAVITLEKLDEVGLHLIQISDLHQIKEIRQSEQLVAVCGGCTYHQDVKLKDLFTNSIISRMATDWLVRNISAE